MISVAFAALAALSVAGAKPVTGCSLHYESTDKSGFIHMVADLWCDQFQTMAAQGRYLAEHRTYRSLAIDPPHGPHDAYKVMLRRATSIQTPCSPFGAARLFETGYVQRLPNPDPNVCEH